MNICYLIHSFSNRAGTESYVYNMSMHMAGLGHKVHIVSLTGKGQWDFGAYDDRITVHQFGLQKDRLARFPQAERIFPVSLWRYVRSLQKLLPTIVEGHDIDIIEATDWGMDALAYLPIRQTPVCVRLHGYGGFKGEFDSRTLKKGPRKYMSWRFQRRHVLDADLVTGVSEAYAAFVRQAWEIGGKEIQIIPIAVDLRVFRPVEAPRDGRSILFAGRLEKHKGMETLSEAMAMVLGQMPETMFYFAGADFHRDDTQQTWSQHLIEMHGHKNVVCLGSLSTQELVRYYQKCTACIVPSLYEAGGTVVFEAMACGCPVLASRVGGLGEVIQDRQTGLLVPPGDAAALAGGLLEMLREKPLRQELSQRALELIRQKFDINMTLRQTLAAYSNAIENFKK